MGGVTRKYMAGMTGPQMRIIAICAVITMIDGFDVLAMSFTAPAIAKAWELGPERLGFLFSAGLAGMMIGSVLLGPVADRIGRRPPILICLAIASAAMFGASISTSYEELMIARLITGFSVGGMAPSVNTLVAEYASPRGRTYAIAITQAGFALGAALGGFLAVWLLASAQWNSVFLAGAIMTGLMLPIAWVKMPESLSYLHAHPERQVEAGAIRARMGELPDPDADAVHGSPARTGIAGLRVHLTPFLLICGTLFSCVMSFYFINSWTPKILIDSGLSQGQGVSGGALLTAGGIFAALGLGHLSLRRSVVPIVAAVTLASAIMTAIFGQLGGSLPLVLAGAFILGTLTSATQIGIYAIIPSLFPSTVRATASGLSSGAAKVGSMIGPSFVGILISAGWDRYWLYPLMALPYVLAAFLISRLKRFQLH